MRKWLRKTLLNAVLDERKRQLSETRPTIVSGTYVSKPHEGFDIYNKKYEVTIDIRPANTPVTVDMLKEIQHKHNIPADAEVTMWDRSEFMSPDITQVKFSWEDPNNIKEKE